MKKVFCFILFFLLLFVSGCVANFEEDPSSIKAPLKITEVGSTYYFNSSSWIEIYNPTNFVVNLSDYKLRCYDTRGVVVLFSLPSIKIYPGSYVIIRGKPYDGLVNSDRIGYVSSGSSIPYWQDRGFVELIHNNQTVDFVRFGSGVNIKPLTEGWIGDNAVSLPFSSNTYGFSLARDGANTDTDGPADWRVTVATPGGPNDIISTNDFDNDGIPDCSEVSGGTFAGLPLYSWGARTNQKDIFIHVCYMDTNDEGVIPRGEALDKVVEAFAKKGIRVHFDVGNLNLSGQTTNNYNLDRLNHKVPCEIPISVITETGFGNLHKYKVNYMDLRKKQIFHFLLFAYSQNPDGSPGPSGIAECPGNDFVVSLGGWGLSSANEVEKNILINFQAATIMHELGHNLGLRHGGNSDENYKPNYYSIMNYMYQLWGLPEIGNEREGDRYYFYRWLECGEANFSNLYFPNAGYWGEEFHRGPTNRNMVIDFSDGSGIYIDENNIYETQGLGRSGSAGVDYNGNGQRNNNGFVMDLNPKPNQNATNVLRDYNDWANLNLFFARSYLGDIQGAKIKLNEKLTLLPDKVGNDIQPIVVETLMPPKMRLKR